ncbi:Protein SZT2, partial [Toxocara canis]
IRCADENIIRTLSTLDQLMTICVHHSSSQLQLDNSTLSGSTRSYVHDISNAIQLISNCFCLRTLLCNVLEREVILLPTLSYRDADPASISRLQILLESLHKELLSTNNVCIEVNDPKLWSQITADVDRNVFSSSSSFPVVHTSTPASPVASLGCSVSSVTETALTPLRVYVSRLSPWRLIVSVLPVLPQHVLAVTSAASPSIPLLVFHCDEPWIAYNLALLDPLPKALYVSDHRTKNTASTLAELNKQVHNIEIPKEDMSSRLLELHWLSEARICASEHRVHTLFNLRSYCETIEDQLFSRAFISAVYRALIEDIYVPSEDLIEATEDRCEQANIEIDDVDDCIRFLCSHVVELRKRTGSFAGILDYPSRSSSTNSLLDDNNARESAMDERSCEDEQEDYRLAFDELISKHFRKVPNLPNYFFYVKDAGVQLPLSQEGAQFRVKLGSGLTRGKVPLGSGGGVSRNSLSDDVEFSYVNDDVNNDFSPIHQQINESEDDELDEDERSSSPNESTSATCISESELLTADSSVDVAPLFLNFSCAIRFPNQTMHTFPIDHLPSCMIKLLRQCPDAPSNILSSRKVPNLPNYFFYVKDADDELDEDERSSSPNESTSATCISESELLTADSSVDVAPLFLNFSCAIRFPNQTMHTFPIDHLPSCMIKLLRQCPDAPSNILSILDQVEVTLDVYVLSWPSMHAVNDHLDSVLTSPSSRLSSPVLPKDPVKYFDFENTPSVDAVDVMVELPQAENRAVQDLRLGISRLLQMEKNLVLSRYDDYRRDTLQKIIDFIVSECAEGNDPDRIKMAEVKIVLVMEPTKALRRLRDRIKQLKLDYCQLSAVPHTHNMFFCCNITDQKRFELTFNKMGPVHRASYISRRADNFPRSGSFSEGYEGRERDSRDSLSTKRSSHLSTGAVLENCDTTYTSKPLSRSSKEERNSVPLPLPSTEGLPKRKTSSVTSRVGTDDEQAFVEPCSRIRRQELNDFWLILTVDAHEAKIYFCQRYALLHTSIFERLREAIEMECRTVNQELLLEKMQQTGECDSLLIASDSVSRKVGRDETFGSVPNTPLTRKYIYSHVVTSKRIHASSSEDEEGDTALAGCARVEYPPGHFACGIVDHHYFFIHPRLQQSKQAAGKSSSFAIGFEALRHGIERFAVRNRRNLYVFREEENANVFYMRLHMTEDSIRENARDPSQSQWMNNLGEMMRNNILLTVHGVRQPGSDLKAIIEAMQKRIDVKVLDEITSTLQKNPQARLTPEDVRFIQRDPSFPDAVFHCTLPNFTEDYLGSLYVYVQQQMLTFAIEARFREHSDGKNDAAFSERTHFYPYVTESNPLPPNYVTPFFVVNRPPSKGSANLGVACVEIRVVDIDGVCKTNLRYADLTTHTHSQLYPGGAKVRRAAVERFHELTRCINTSLPLPESLRSGAGKIAALMEFNVWQAGDVGLPSLHARFRLAVQQALCDLVTEFGLLSCPVFDLQAPFSPVLFRAPTVSVSKSRGGQHLPTLRKRSSSDALLGPTLISPSKTAQLSSVRLEQPAVLSRNEAIRRSAQSTQTMFNFDDTKRNSLTLISALSNTDGTPSSSSEDTNFTPTYVNCQFAAVAREWFDHMVSEVKNNTEQQFSLKKHMFHLDSDHSARKICRVIGERLCGIVCRETVTVCQLETNGSNRYCTLSCGESFIMPFCSDDGRVVDSEHVKISLMLIAFNHDYAEAVLRYGADCSERLLPDALAEVTSSGDNSFRFLPHVSPFVPRQHLLFFIVRGEVASLYLYNYSAKAAERIQKLFSSIISWHNGRSRLLREIGLHKMGITHLPASISPSCKGLVWLNAALLYKYDFPEEGTAEFDQQFINDVLEPSEARLRMKLYRHSNASFLAINLMPTFFEDQCEQMLMIENETSSLMRDHQRFRAVHQSLLAGSCEMSETDLILITMRSREVHFVKSPLLLFSRWRRRIAAIRISAETSNDFRHSLAEDPSARRASGSRLSKYEAPVHNASKFQFRSNTFSTTIEGFSKTSLTRIRRYTEEDDPCSLKIQFMLVESYVEYAKKLGWHFLTVKDVSPLNVRKNPYTLRYDTQNTECSPNVWLFKVAVEQSGCSDHFLLSYVEYAKKLGWHFLTVKDVSPLNVRKNPYTLRYDTQNTECSPNVWLFKVAAGGIIFVQLTFVEPYFSVRILVWNASQLCNVIPIEDGGTAVVENLRELETIKDEMVSRGHVHSFTYDFHLRMVATYLVGGQQVLFNQGYNTNAFLIDFLQYYGCRPPYARNCIYEERVEFSHLPVNSTLIWEHFLVEKSSEWRVVRLKPLNTGASDQFMLVSEEPKEYLGQAYKAIRVVLHDQQAKAVRDCLAIKFYIILVASERTDPFVENVMFGSGAQACVEMGEFKEMESVREDENEIEDGNTSQFEFTTDTSESTTPCGRRRFCSGDHVPSLRAADITRKFSTGVQCLLFRTDTSESTTPCGRRRFCSGDHVPSLRAADITRKFSTDADSMLASRSVDRYAATNEDNPRLSIQKNAPRRHRKQVSKWHAQRMSEHGAVLPREQVIYVHYLSVRQRKLQEELEDSVVHYRLRLQKLVEDAGWHCKRDQLWNSMLECPTKRAEANTSGSSRKFFAESSTDVGAVLRNVTSTALSVSDIDKLLGYVRSKSMFDVEPMLDVLTRDFAADPFFRFLILHFGEKRCRFFCSDVKKHLVIMSNSPQHSAFLMTVFAKDHLEMRLIYKDHGETNNDWLAEVMDDPLRAQFDEIVRCAASFCWMEVVHSSPSGKIRT